MRWGLPALSGGLAITSFVALPIWAFTHVPLASKAVGTAYVEAGNSVKDAEDKEKTEGESVLVPWEDALALDAGLLNQDFNSIKPSALTKHAEEIVLLFVEKHEETTTCPEDPKDPTCTPKTRRWFTLYSLDGVMSRKGLSNETKDWIRTMRKNAYLVMSTR